MPTYWKEPILLRLLLMLAPIKTLVHARKGFRGEGKEKVLLCVGVKEKRRFC